jgi:hypothetical protein
MNEANPAYGTTTYATEDESTRTNEVESNKTDNKEQSLKGKEHVLTQAHGIASQDGWTVVTYKRSKKSKKSTNS